MVLYTNRGVHPFKESVRINDQGRICFRWREGNAYDGVQPRRSNEIVHGKRSISADTARQPRCASGVGWTSELGGHTAY
jgi:hypothetical protein